MVDGETTALVAEVSTDPKYVQAKTSVWWDIENCRVPRDCDPYSIAQNIISALSKMNYCGPVSISAYGDTNQIPNHVQQALSSTGISLNHVPAGVKDASDKKILVDMLFWAVDNPAPATYLLISGDRDFSNALHQLRMRRYDILLAQPVQASAALVSAAKTAWLWTSLVAGGGPITKSELVVTLEEPSNKGNQQRQTQQNKQLSCGSKRSPPPSKIEKKSSRARTETTKKGSAQCSNNNKGPLQCHNCAETGHINRNCVKEKRKCFLCGREGHMRLFCRKVQPKPAQSPQEQTTRNNSTLIGPASELSLKQKKRKHFDCGEEGHMLASWPQKSGLTHAQSQPASASCIHLSCNNPRGPASELLSEQNKRRCYICKKEGHMLTSCPQGVPSLAQSQQESVSYSYSNLPCNNSMVPPFEHSATQNTGATPVTSSSQGQQLHEMSNVDQPKVPVTQADCNSGPGNVLLNACIADSVVPSGSP